MGADIEVLDTREEAGEPVGDLRVRSADLSGTEIGGDEVPACIDELPVLAVAAAAAHGRTTIRDAAELRVKESDRIAAVAQMLSRLGIAVVEHRDGLDIEGGRLIGDTEIDASGDHRIAMSATIAALIARSSIAIHGAEAASVSYPAFYATVERLTTGRGEG
jgi:3-phosphoshikimate 1-carboxyvinyltransferase